MKRTQIIKYPKGFPDKDHTQIAVRFPTPLFGAIIEMAKREKKTFNDMVVELVKVGKLDLEESDILEPTHDEDKEIDVGAPITDRQRTDTKTSKR